MDVSAEQSPFKVPHASPGYIKDGVTMQVYIDADFRKRVDKAANRQGVSRSEFVRQALRQYMEASNTWSLAGPERKST